MAYLAPKAERERYCIEMHVPSLSRCVSDAKDRLLALNPSSLQICVCRRRFEYPRILVADTPERSRLRVASDFDFKAVILELDKPPCTHRGMRSNLARLMLHIEYRH